MSTRIILSYEAYEFDAKKNRYCICVFVINEGEKLLNQLKTMSGICNGLVDVVVADGGSTDGSTDHDTLKRLGVNTLLVKTGEGKLGSQMRMAFDWALNRGYEGVVVVDGNGKDGMDAIPRFVDELKNGVDHVQGSRFIKGGHHENTPKSRLWGLKLLHVPMMRLASGFKYTDTTNGFRGYSAKLLSSDKLNIFRKCFAGYELHYYLAIEAARQGFQCSEIPVSRVYPAVGKVPTKIKGIKGNLNVIGKLFLSCLHIQTPGKIFIRYCKTYLIFLLSIVFFYYAFNSLYSNSFSVVENNKFANWQTDSEQIVVRDKIDPATRYNKKWLSFYPMANHYIGGQGIASSFIVHFCESASTQTKVEILHTIEVGLAVIALTYLFYWVGTELSILAALCLGICTIYSPFTVISARNIYWSMWTMYMPLSLLLFSLRRDENNNKCRLLVVSYHIITGVMVFAFCVTHYEFLSSTMILVELPLIYYALKNEWSSKKYLINALTTGIVSLATFVLSFLLLILQMLVYRADFVFSAAWGFATENIRYRTGVGGENAAETFVNSFITDLPSLFDTYLNFDALFSYKMYDIIACFLYSVSAVSFVLLFFKTSHGQKTRKISAFFFITLLSLSLQFIWIITAKGHSYIHVMINNILWAIPTLLIGASIGFALSILIEQLKKIKSIFSNRYSFLLALFIVAGAVAAYGLYYYSNYSGYGLMIERFKNQGINVNDTDDIQYLFFKNQKKLLVRIPEEMAKAHTIFFHFHPANIEFLPPERAQIGFDYKYYHIKGDESDPVIQKPPFSKNKYTILQIPLPVYPCTLFKVGQYDRSQLWAFEIKEAIPDERSYLIRNLVDPNWDHGVRRNNPQCILFSAEQCILPNDIVTFPDGTKCAVTKTNILGNYLEVYLDENAPSFDQSKPIVFSKPKSSALPSQQTKPQTNAQESSQNNNTKGDSRKDVPAGNERPVAVPVMTKEKADKMNSEARTAQGFGLVFSEQFKTYKTPSLTKTIEDFLEGKKYNVDEFKKREIPSAWTIDYSTIPSDACFNKTDDGYSIVSPEEHIRFIGQRFNAMRSSFLFKLTVKNISDKECEIILSVYNSGIVKKGYKSLATERINSKEEKTIEVELSVFEQLANIVPTFSVKGTAILTELTIYRKDHDDFTIVEGEIVERSMLPDPKDTDYPDCRYTAHFVGNAILSGMPCNKEIAISIDGFIKKQMLPTNQLKAGDKIQCAIVPIDSLPVDLASIQEADDLSLFTLDSYYVTTYSTISSYTDQKNNYNAIVPFKSETLDFKSVFGQGFNPPIPESIKNAQKKKIEMDLEEANKMIAYIEENKNEIEQRFQAAWTKEKERFPSGINTIKNENGNILLYWRNVDDSFWCLPPNYTFIPKSPHKLPRDKIDAIVAFKDFLESNGIQLIVSLVPDRYTISSRVINSCFKDIPEVQSATYVKQLSEAGIECPYETTKILENYNKFPFAYLFPNDHPGASAQYSIAEAIGERLSRYNFPEKLDMTLFSYNIIKPVYDFNANIKDTSFPANCDIGKFDPNGLFLYEEILYNGKSVTKEKDSKILVLGNSFIETPISSQGSFPAFLSKRMLYPVDNYVVRAQGPMTTIIQRIFENPESFLKGKEVVILQMAAEQVKTDDLWNNIADMNHKRLLLNGKKLVATLHISGNGDYANDFAPGYRDAWRQFEDKNDIKCFDDEQFVIFNQPLTGIDTTKAFTCIVQTARSPLFAAPSLIANGTKSLIPASHAPGVVFWQNTYFELPAASFLKLELHGKKNTIVGFNKVLIYQ